MNTATNSLSHSTRILLQDFAGHHNCLKGGSLKPRCRRVRLGLISGILLIWTAIIFVRLYSLQISDFEKWQDWAFRQHVAQVQLASERAPLYDRSGKMLAMSVPAASVYVRPGLVKDKLQLAQRLSELLNLDRKYVLAKLEDKKPFSWLTRQIPRNFAERVADLANPAVGYMLESRRVYPYNQVASALIGKVGLDGSGLSGIEAVHDQSLQGKNISTQATRDAFGKHIQMVSAENRELELPRGEEIRLTIDADIAAIVDEELANGREDAHAKATVAVMVDAQSGEILAMGQSPSLNFNSAKVKSKSDLKNLAIETAFEPGSIMKPIVAAAALDSGVIKSSDLIDCEHGQFQFAGHTIKDVHPSDTISMYDVLVRSSNIGMSKLGIRMGETRLYSSLRRFGFGDSSQLGLMGETRGILRPLDSWSKVDIATHSFGQGVAVTPLQMVRAMAAIANGGRLPQLRLIDDGQSANSVRIISEASAREVQKMLYGVVEEEHGTGQKAQITGLRVGGKTGTAQKAKANGRGYAPGSYVASFVGFADGAPLGVHKTLALMVMVDEAHTKSIYGGTLAAPIFKKIMQRSMALLATKQQLETPSVATPRGFERAKALIPEKNKSNPRPEVVARQALSSVAS